MHNRGIPAYMIFKTLYPASPEEVSTQPSAISQGNSELQGSPPLYLFAIDSLQELC